MLSCVDVPLEREELEELVDKAKDMALMNGGGMRSKKAEGALELLPLTLFPSVVSRSAFEKAIDAQVVFNKLFHRIAHDRSFLTESLQSAGSVDDFTRRLLEIYDSGPGKQSLCLGLLRSDYMENNGVYRQVELNTVATSLSGISFTTTQIHGYVLKELGEESKLCNIPENNALTGFAQGLVNAWRHLKDERRVIVFVVEEWTYNICDQRMLEFAVREMEPKARVIRRTLDQLSRASRLEENGDYLVDGKTIAGVVYYRVGYDPSHYKSENDWKVRLEIELSNAIKCPSIEYHLAGTKKIQQILSNEGVVERFLDVNESRIARSMFTQLYSLDFTEEGEIGVKMSEEEPENLVLKPQREGGGNNVYGEEIREAVANLGRERPGWILMRRLKPKQTKNYILRSGNCPVLIDVVSELGVFGVVLGDKSKILMNTVCGHALRTKPTTSDEGGVSSGFGAIDSPYLV